MKIQTQIAAVKMMHEAVFIAPSNDSTPASRIERDSSPESSLVNEESAEDEGDTGTIHLMIMCMILQQLLFKKILR